ncbi:D-alanine--poly(phosphoribitol) ligase subunit DltC [Anaerovorax odorimutans]|uniref:D-alanyl carrier protein n=1 Tax=Anaerovorax odorimutans TaxID=109327 RepID=A0ABT1RQ67_9FIRM|nr:D-alanine--poly(phosphoribitol) ligase subunit DltC [Anaerovorax odorimutans]MCQ4637341.1 D-alanine--poly(phosphoribitol) ligase subunit DltC [Anaerovorax odorimutans]
MEEKVLDLLEEICEDDVVREDLDINLFEEDLMDSLAFTELLVGIEENFGIVISPSEVERSDVETPNKIIALIKARS